MDFKFDDMLGKISDFLLNEAKTETVIGKEFQLGEFHCVPVIKVSMGFGSGGGGGEDPKRGHGEGGGAGAGLSVAPIAFLVSKDDKIEVLNVSQSKGLSKMFEKVPDLMDKYFEKRNNNKETDKAEKEEKK